MDENEEDAAMDEKDESEWKWWHVGKFDLLYRVWKKNVKADAERDAWLREACEGIVVR